jgi:DNA-binding NtrC family response regulator
MGDIPERMARRERPGSATGDDTRRTAIPPRTLDDLRSYLAVIDGEASRLCELPAEGEVCIGRMATCDLVLKNPSVSRCHADLRIARGTMSLSDRRSTNGTFVNGRKVAEAVVLQDGDVLSIGEVTLVLHHQAAPTGGVPAFDLVTERLEECLHEIIASHRTASILVLYGSRWRDDDRKQILAFCRSRLHAADLSEWHERGYLWLILPGGADDVRRHLLEDLCASWGPVFVGSGNCPTDGCDTGGLLALARMRLEAAIAEGSSLSNTEITLGDRSIIVADEAMIRIYDLIRRLAPSDLPVLILGETGVGKESAALAVHCWSSRHRQPFVTLNSAALPETLIESELFGYEKGAFSGAISTKPGLFETAAGGTIFLDEVGDLSLTAQAKLLRALDSKRILRVGGTREIEIDVRIVAATNHELGADVNAGRFRRDLFHRLSAAQVVVPPLRERKRELALLTRLFLSDSCNRVGRPILEISPKVMQELLSYRWPGNIRELRNVIEFSVVTSNRDASIWTDLPSSVGSNAQGVHTSALDAEGETHSAFVPLSQMLRAFERRRMLEALEAAGGVQKRAAELLGMPLRTFMLRMKQHGLVVERRVR